MLIKKDIIEYFEQIKTIEVTMERMYAGMARDITTPEYRKIFEKLCSEEQVHAEKIETLIDMFK
jgi:rubrerythrin